jgi:hypothetical protein
MAVTWSRAGVSARGWTVTRPLPRNRGRGGAPRGRFSEVPASPGPSFELPRRYRHELSRLAPYRTEPPRHAQRSDENRRIRLAPARWRTAYSGPSSGSRRADLGQQRCSVAHPGRRRKALGNDQFRGPQPHWGHPMEREAEGMSAPQSGQGADSGPISERQSKQAPPRRSLGRTTISRPQNEHAWYRSSALAKLRRSAATNIARQRLLPRYIMAWTAARIFSSGPAPQPRSDATDRASAPSAPRCSAVPP